MSALLSVVVVDEGSGVETAERAVVLVEECVPDVVGAGVEGEDVPVELLVEVLVVVVEVDDATVDEGFAVVLVVEVDVEALAAVEVVEVEVEAFAAVEVEVVEVVVALVVVEVVVVVVALVVVEVEVVDVEALAVVEVVEVEVAALVVVEALAAVVPLL